MSTHLYRCSMCRAGTSCNDDTYVLAITDGCDAQERGEGPKVFFCSKKCFEALKLAMAEREAYARSDMWTAECMPHYDDMK